MLVRFNSGSEQTASLDRTRCCLAGLTCSILCSALLSLVAGQPLAGLLCTCVYIALLAIVGTTSNANRPIWSRHMRRLTKAAFACLMQILTTSNSLFSRRRSVKSISRRSGKSFVMYARYQGNVGATSYHLLVGVSSNTANYPTWEVLTTTYRRLVHGTA